MKTHANGIDIHYQISGSGPWLTLSHSLGCDLSQWESQIEAFSKRFTVLRYDTRGHGKTSAPVGPYTWTQLCDDAIALFDSLKIERTHFLGLSMGGMIAQHLALAKPERIDSLILCDTSPGNPAANQSVWQERIKIVREKGTAALVSATLERWFTAPYRASHPDVMARIGKIIETTPAEGYIGCGLAIAALDVGARLWEIKAPTLVIVGAEDTGTTPEVAKQIAAAIPGARLEIIPSAAHLSNVEQAERFSEVVLDFLRAH